MEILETVTLPPPIFSRNFETAVIIHCHIYDFEKKVDILWFILVSASCDLYLTFAACFASLREVREPPFFPRGNFAISSRDFGTFFHVILTPTARFFGAERPADSIESCTDAMRFV